MRRARRIRQCLGAIVGCWAVLGLLAAIAVAQAPPPQRTQLTEPVYRISKAKIDQNASVAAHPLDPAIALAENGLESLRQNVRDYTCVMIKRERINGTLNDYEYMFAKIRQEQDVRGVFADLEC